jgi:hypothetical protein
MPCGDRLHAHRLKADPGLRVAHLGSTWTNPMRALLAEDGRSVDVVVEVIDWAAADPFWCSRILTPAHLRRHMATLVAQVRAPARPAPGRPVEPVAADRFAHYDDGIEDDVSVVVRRVRVPHPAWDSPGVDADHEAGIRALAAKLAEDAEAAGAPLPDALGHARRLYADARRAQVAEAAEFGIVVEGSVSGGAADDPPGDFSRFNADIEG